MDDDRKWPQEASARQWPSDADVLLIAPEPPFYLPDTFSVRGRDEAAQNYSEGFKRAAETILHELQNTCSEILVFPFIFLWRHHLELSIKNLIRLISHQRGIKPPQLEHQLPGAWGALTQLIKAEIAESEEVKAAVLATSRILREFHKLDEDSFDSRYPEPKHGDKPKNGDPGLYISSLPTLPRHFDFNHFAQVVQKVSCLIDCLYLHFSHQTDSAE